MWFRSTRCPLKMLKPCSVSSTNTSLWDREEGWLQPDSLLRGPLVVCLLLRLKQKLVLWRQQGSGQCCYSRAQITTCKLHRENHQTPPPKLLSRQPDWETVSDQFNLQVSSSSDFFYLTFEKSVNNANSKMQTWCQKWKLSEWKIQGSKSNTRRVNQCNRLPNSNMNSNTTRTNAQDAEIINQTF